MSFKKILPGKTVTIRVNGSTREVQEEQSVAAALLESGQFVSNAEMRNQDKTGPTCMMGVCYGCLVNIDGKNGKRACMTRVKEEMAILTGDVTGEDGE